MAVLLLRNNRTMVQPAHRATAAAVSGLVGLIQCANEVSDLCGGGALFTRVGNAPITYTSAGPAVQTNNTTLGIASNPVRKGMPGWEIPVFTYLAFYQIDSFVASTANTIGYSTGGGFGEGFGIGRRRYWVGATGVSSTGTWPLGSPFSAALTFDGTNMQGYFNGVADGALTASSTAYGVTSGLFIGHTSDQAGFNGRVHYLALFNRVLTVNEIAFYAQNPFAIYGPLEAKIWVSPAAGGGNSIVAPLGTLTLNGLTPTLDQSQSIVAPLGQITLQGLAPALNQTQSIVAPLGSLNLSGLVPTLDQSESIVAPLGTLTLNGLVPTFAQGNTMQAPLGSLNLSGLVPTINQTQSIVAPLGTLSMNGLQASFAQSGQTATQTNYHSWLVKSIGVKTKTVLPSQVDSDSGDTS